MEKLITIEEFITRVNSEGLGYTLCWYYSIEHLKTIEDKELSKLCVKAAKLLGQIEDIIKNHEDYDEI
jgi:hypothetical protein